MKLICVLPVKNSGSSLIHFVSCISPLVDGIIIIDDRSDDPETLGALYGESILHTNKTLEIISKRVWRRDEPGDRNLLLNRARYYGGSHLLVLDSDEMLTANFLKSPDQFRSIIFSLNPGDRLFLRWIQLWRSTKFQRSDVGLWHDHYKPFIFADHPNALYSSDFIHTERAPTNLTGRSIKLGSASGGVLHFQYCDWTSVQIKHIWYQMLEIIRKPEKSVSSIRSLYEASLDESTLEVSEVPDSWVSFLDKDFCKKMVQPGDWRRYQIRAWLADFGQERFQNINTFGHSLAAI